MMQALPAPDATPVNSMQQSCLPVSAAALPSAPASIAGSARAAGPNKYYSPLNTNKGQGSVVAQLLEMRSSMHYGSDNGGDTHSLAASDQQAPRDKNVAVTSQVGAPRTVTDRVLVEKPQTGSATAQLTFKRLHNCS
jgi:hypothetical protein